MAGGNVVLVRRPVEMRAVPGFEGRYSITRDGRVWSHERIVDQGVQHRGTRWLQRRKGRWLKPHFDTSVGRGYFVVTLGGRNGRKWFIHQLVILTWGPPQPTPEHEVNHIDLDTRNNWFENLEWLLHGDNIRHATSRGRHGGYNLLTDADHAEIRRRYADGELQKDLARDFGITQPSVSYIINGRKTRQ